MQKRLMLQSQTLTRKTFLSPIHSTKRSLLIYKEGLLLDIGITTETTAVFILNMSAFKVGAPQSSFAVLLFKMI